MSDPNNKDRRKSAHWTDADTAVLIDVLLRYKDTGRTQDNGFKPEVWKEAAELVKGSTIIGGPKTPEACKSRWQRRDFKAVKELEMIPGFTWDRTQHKLCASQEAWEAAEKTVDAHKCQKIHLPAYDALVILCPVDANKLRNKPRSSLGATSDTSSMLSMSVGNPQTPSMNPMTGTPTGMVNGQLGTMDMGMGDGMLQWDANMDGDGDFEGSFTMPDGQIFTMTRGQKRMATFDSSMLGSSTQTIALDGRTSPPKRARTSSADILHQRNPMMQQQQQGQQRQQQQQPQQQTPIQRQQSDMRQGHSHPQPAQHHGHTHQPSNLTVFPMHLPPQPTNSPEYPTTTSHLNPHSLMSSPTQLTSASLQAVTGHPHSQPQQTSQSQPMHQHNQNHAQQLHQYQQAQQLAPQPPPHTLPQIAANPFVGKAESSVRYAPPSHPPPLPPPSRPTPPPGPSRRVSPVQSESALDKVQIHQAGLSEAQRRTQAILQLQSREMDMPDEDLVEVLAEFEANVAVADTYLAIQRDGLRRMYLGKVIKRRKGG